MRAVILSLGLMAAALPALAQTGPAPSREALTLGSRAAHSANPRLEQGLQALVDSLANNYRNDAARLGDTVDEKALTDATKGEAEAVKPSLWDSMARIYAETYTVDDLKALNNFYRDNPGAPATNLPASLAAKNGDIQQRQQALVAQIGPRIRQDLFGDYCSRAPCNDNLRQAVGLPVRAAKAN